jgi:hypothetical protein
MSIKSFQCFKALGNAIIRDFRLCKKTNTEVENLYLSSNLQNKMQI